jgi:hypothetical protein
MAQGREQVAAPEQRIVAVLERLKNSNAPVLLPVSFSCRLLTRIIHAPRNLRQSVVRGVSQLMNGVQSDQAVQKDFEPLELFERIELCPGTGPLAALRFNSGWRASRATTGEAWSSDVIS